MNENKCKTCNGEKEIPTKDRSNKDEKILKAFKKDMKFDDVNRIMEGGVSVPLLESEYFQCYKAGVLSQKEEIEEYKYKYFKANDRISILSDQLSEKDKQIEEICKENDIYVDKINASAERYEMIETKMESMRQPEHETVEQWEKRTGEVYPDDGPAWHNSMICGKKTLIISEYSYYKKRGIDNYCIIANHYGKPEEV